MSIPLDQIRDFVVPLVSNESSSVDWRQGWMFVVGSSETHAIGEASDETLHILQTIMQEIRTITFDEMDPNVQVSYQDHERTIPFRVHFVPETAERRDRDRTGVVMIRQAVTEMPSLSQLNLPPFWAEFLQARYLTNGGLVLFVGSTGSGKTTSMYGTLRNRLERYAGMALTIENPVEIPCPSTIGRGLLLQTDLPRRLNDIKVPQDEAWSHCLSECLRSFPSIPSGKVLMLGEVRHPGVAAECLQISSSGHLVLATSHGSNIIDGLERFAALAANVVGAESARRSLAGCLRLVVHQSMQASKAAGGARRVRVVGNLLALREATDTGKPGAAANVIADPKETMRGLNDTISSQNTALDNLAQQCDYATLTAVERTEKFRTLVAPHSDFELSADKPDKDKPSL